MPSPSLAVEDAVKDEVSCGRRDSSPGGSPGDKFGLRAEESNTHTE